MGAVHREGGRAIGAYRARRPYRARRRITDGSEFGPAVVSRETLQTITCRSDGLSRVY